MRIPLAAPTFTSEELAAAAHVLQHEHLTMGVYCERFERQFADTFGRRNAIYVNSGSSANLLAFFCIANPDTRRINGKRGWPRRSTVLATPEVIVPALTWSTTIWPIVQIGAIPVFVDSDPNTLQMRVDQIEAAISDRTIAICVPHIMGNAVPMKEITALAKKYDLWVIEDTCEALGTKHNGHLVGNFSDFSTFSFYFSHHITTIEGGMILTDNDYLADILRAMRSHGWIRQMHNQEPYTRFRKDLDPRYLFATTGFNLRPTEVNAALGLSQLDRLPALNASRNRVGKFLQDHLPTGLRSMRITEGTDEAWFGFPILCNSREERIDLTAHLEANDIETRPIVCGNICRHPAMANIDHIQSVSLAGADEIMELGLYMGVHPGMDDPEVYAYLNETFAKWRPAAMAAT